jgi:cysteine synthase B
MNKQQYPTIESTIGHTPLVRLQRMLVNPRSLVLAKLEGNNPAGSVKDRPAMSMIREAEARGRIKPGDTIIEATSGNTGIALAMAAAIRGYRLILIMPSHMSSERKLSMAAYGAELIEVTQSVGMEGARDLADHMAAAGEGIVLDQFANPDNPLGHVSSTGPEIWEQTNGDVTHFVSSMGTTGTIMGVSSYLKAKNPAVEIVGLQPIEGSQIPGIRRWSEAYRPKIFDATAVDRVVDVSQSMAEETMRRMAREEGIFAGVSSGASIATALEIAESHDNVTVVCDCV